MPPAALIDPRTIDTSKVLHDLEAIRAGNRQRFEMEMLSAVILVDHDDHLIVGYKDVTDHEFWVRGHMPGYPLMPGVMMCEAAAQLSSFYCHLLDLVHGGFLGLGGIEDVRFRGQVRPGDRLVLMAKAAKVHRRQMVFETQGFVDGSMVFQARIIGMVLPAERGR